MYAGVEVDARKSRVGDNKIEAVKMLNVKFRMTKTEAICQNINNAKAQGSENLKAKVKTDWFLYYCLSVKLEKPDKRER